LQVASAPTIPVRLPPNLLGPLDAWAKSIGLSRSAAIKLCLAQQLGVVEKADSASLRVLDGRTHRYARVERAFAESKRLAAERRAARTSGHQAAG
jgi:hypothetical protein